MLPDVANQSSGRDGLNEVTLGNNTLRTVKIREDKETDHEKGPKLIDSLKIEVIIFSRKYIALLDTEAHQNPN